MSVLLSVLGFCGDYIIIF